MKSKAKNSKLVGKEVIHKDLGRCIVTSAIPGSFTKVNVTCIQRAPGWNEATQSYRRVKLPTVLLEDGTRSLRWKVNHLDQYGHKDIAHVNELTVN